MDGTTELRVVEEHFSIDLPGKPTDTINRWILKHAQRIPLVDEQFEIDGLNVQVQQASSRRIHKVVLQKLNEENPSGAAVSD
jgi:CBS domain containing-hemolysin-like protein